MLKVPGCSAMPVKASLPNCGFEGWLSLLRRHEQLENPWLVVPVGNVRDGQNSAVSYRDLCDAVARVACGLHNAGLCGGQRVLVIADNRPECAILLLGVLAAGAVLVPVAPRGPWRSLDAWRSFTERVCVETSAVAILGADEHGAWLDQHRPGAPFLGYSALMASRVNQLPRAPDGTDEALIQYTSGTTGISRGVVLTHSNLLRNVQGIGAAIGATSRDIGVSWLPLFHDMGLIGGLLFTTYWGMTNVMLTPRGFGMRPESWLHALTQYRASYSVAPNSAYHVCASKVPAQKLSGIDLSHWRVAFNGAELVHVQTLQQFSERFSAYGFSPVAMYPVYGLAESTVAACLPVCGHEPRLDWIDPCVLESDGVALPREALPSGRSRGIVCVGGPLAEHELRVVEPESCRTLLERTVGEIQLRGPSVMRGYVRAEGRDPFTHDGWLRTGDRGYVAHGGLYVVGRYKQIVKRAGRTLDAPLIENLLRELPGIRGGAVAVFGVPDADRGTERLVVVAETSAQSAAAHAELRAAICARMIEQLELTADQVELVPPGRIPRTTSGKIRHEAAREIFLALQSEPPREPSVHPRG